jgi:hypothetical protein
MVTKEINRICKHCGGPVAPPLSPCYSHPYCSKRCSALAQPRRDVGDRFWSRVNKTETCWLWTASVNKRSGYGQFFFNGRQQTSHRVAYELSYGPVPDGLEVCHNCPNGDNPRCVNPTHLFAGSHADNMRDMANKGRAMHGDRHRSKTHPERLCRGENRSDHKLTDAIVRIIRAERAIGTPYSVLARRFGVTTGTIFPAAKGRTWRHVK